jgi:hypothetical protein
MPPASWQHREVRTRAIPEGRIVTDSIEMLDCRPARGSVQSGGAVMSFKEIALPLAAMSVPVIRLQSRSKVPMEKSWPSLATTDVSKILAWDSETPNANCACVAKPDGVLFFETDEPLVIERYEKETGEKLPKTFTVQSREGRYHFYWLQTEESRKCGSITQKSIPFGSLRQREAFVVAPGSIHPTTGLPYTVVDESPIVPIPTKLIDWLVSQKTKIEKANPSATSKAPIPLGQHDVTLTAIAGKLRQDGLEHDEILPVLIRNCEERCVGYGSDYLDMCKKIAKSVCRYPAGDPSPTVLIGGKLPSQQTKETREPVEVVPDSILKNPKAVTKSLAQYPLWAWNGTLYEDFAQLCGKDNFIPHEFFIESIKTVVGAVCGHRIQPDGYDNQQPARWYTILIGPGGGGKSSASKWAINLFIGTGLVYELQQSGAFLNVGCAKGSFASSSGMIKHGWAKHSRILQTYDEITTVIEKFGITGSGGSFLDMNNELFEYCPTAPSSITKESKDDIKVGRGEVHNSILGCTTPLRWQNAFKKTNSDNSGFFQRLNVISNASSDRVAQLLVPDFSGIRDLFVRKIQPLEFQKVVVRQTPEATDLFDKWYSEKLTEWENLSDDIKGRIQVMVVRNASHLAWLMSGDDVLPDAEKASEPIEVTCDEDIMNRAIALAEYEIRVRQLHKPIEADNPYAQIENAIERYFVENEGQPVTRRDLYRILNANRHVQLLSLSPQPS